MNILIVGEFSGFARHLKLGFESLGHRVVIVMNGDSFKNIPHSGEDIYYKSRKLNIMGRDIPGSYIFFSKKTNQYILDRLESLNLQFNLIIIICDQFISVDNTTAGVPIAYVENQAANGAKVIFTSCGGDAAYLIFKRELWYYDIAFPRTIKNIVDERPTRKKTGKLNRILSITDCIVPTAYDYYYTINRFLDTYYKKDIPIFYQPLPISETETQFHSCKGRKILIFHGVIRAIPKGTKYIVEALNRIKQDYPEKVDVVVKGNMPYQEYVTLFDKIDILIDQTNGYGSGMNANIGLINGKVVLSNNEPEEEQIRGFKSPVINLRPDPDQIYGVLKELINNPDKIDRLKQESRDYAMEHLRSDVVAKKYLGFVGL